MPYTVTTDADTEPLSLAEVRMQLKNEGITIDDDLLNIYIKAARQLIEEKTGTAMLQKTITEVFNAFPDVADDNPYAAVKLSVSPVLSVTSVKYKDGDGNDQTIDSSDYDIDKASKPGKVAPKPSYSWPSTYTGINAVTIVYNAGYAETASLPFALRQAMLLTIAHWYRNRVDTPRSLPSQADWALKDYRIREF